MRAQHWKEPIGKRFEIGQGQATQKGTVVGVVQDFNFRSVHEGVGPFAIYRRVEDFSRVAPVLRMHEERTMVLNITGRNVPATLKFVGDTMRKFDGLHPFEFEFVDDSLQRLYVSDMRLTRLIAIFAGICIFIACLGCSGSHPSWPRSARARSAFAKCSARAPARSSRCSRTDRVPRARRGRGRERVVLSRDEGVARELRVPRGINPLIFVAAALAGLGIAYLTVALQSMKAARAHPVTLAALRMKAEPSRMRRRTSQRRRVAGSHAANLSVFRKERVERRPTVRSSDRPFEAMRYRARAVGSTKTHNGFRRAMNGCSSAH